MSGRNKASKPGAGQRVPSRLEIPGQLAVPPTATPSPFSDPLLQQRYQELIRKHLGKLLDHLFAEFTGLHFHIAWAPTLDHEWAARSLPTACSVCCRLSGSPLRPGCKTCGPRQLAHTLRADGDGHRFTCQLGVRNYWLALRLREETTGIAYLQALDGHHGKPPARKSAARAKTIVLGQLKFARAARLLRFVVGHVQTASLADLRKADLTNAGHAVVALEKEQARLHEALQHHLPPTAPAASRRSGPESHPEQLVQRLLEFVERDYAKPITLRHCAAKLGMNAAYLSDLFSHALGVPFKTQLTELRMAKAKGLLTGSTQNISTVAYAVGYTTADGFRLAFKQATGLSPKLWRETMQTTPPV